MVHQNPDSASRIGPPHVPVFPCSAEDIVYCIERTGMTTIVPDAVRALLRPSITDIARRMATSNSNSPRCAQISHIIPDPFTPVVKTTPHLYVGGNLALAPDPSYCAT